MRERAVIGTAVSVSSLKEETDGFAFFTDNTYALSFAIETAARGDPAIYFACDYIGYFGNGWQSFRYLADYDTDTFQLFF